MNKIFLDLTTAAVDVLILSAAEQSQSCEEFVRHLNWAQFSMNGYVVSAAAPAAACQYDVASDLRIPHIDRISGNR